MRAGLVKNRSLWSMVTWLFFPFSCRQNEGLSLQSLLRETVRAPGSKQKPFLRAHKCVSLAQDRPLRASPLRLVNTEPPGIHQPLFSFSYHGPISHGTYGSWVPTLVSYNSLYLPVSIILGKAACPVTSVLWQIWEELFIFTWLSFLLIIRWGDKF